jgi:hypothetical protein
MWTWKFWTTLLAAIGVVAIAAAPHYCKTRTQMRCSIPDRDYQYKRLSQPKRSVSAVGIPLRGRVDAIADTAPAPSIQAFQFVDTPTLQIDHCSLSKMSVLLRKSGHWTVSFRADQNPAGSGAQATRRVTTAEPKKKATSHLLRNQFYVRVTCYGPSGNADESLLGKPVIAPLELEPFWVQKAVPYPYYATGHDQRIEDHFQLIDRVEIEFSYRME